MSSFKVGDRVERVGGDNHPLHGMFPGTRWTVNSVRKSNGDISFDYGTHYWDKDYFRLVDEYEWPCRICDATERWDGEAWVPTPYPSTCDYNSYNHRRKLITYRPVCADDANKTVLVNGGPGKETSAVLWTWGKEWCVVSPGVAVMTSDLRVREGS